MGTRFRVQGALRARYKVQGTGQTACGGLEGYEAESLKAFLRMKSLSLIASRLSSLFYLVVVYKDLRLTVNG